MIRRFFEINRNLTRRIESHLPQAKTDLWEMYCRAVQRFMNSKPNQIVADIGGGRGCLFAGLRDPGLNTKIIAVDVSEEEVRFNRDVDERRIADVMRELPFSDGEVDILTSKSVLEHLEDIETFMVNSRRALKKGGYFIHLFPSKFAPFAVANQILPKRFSRKILLFFHPDKLGICGFPAFYDRTYYKPFKNLLERHGFEIVDIRFSWHQSRYLSFFLPAYLLSVLYDWVIYSIGAKNLASYMLVIARKR